MKIVNKGISLAVVFMMAFLLTACASGTDNTAAEQSESIVEEGGAASEETEEVETEEAAASEKTTPVAIEDLEWSVDEGVKDGKRYVFLTVTNNSDYDLAGVQFDFIQSASASEEDMENYYSWAVKEHELDAEDEEEIRSEELSMEASTDRPLRPGETASNIHFHYYHGIMYVMNYEFYSLVEPDLAEIRYIENGKIFKEYYDFKSGKYTIDDRTEDADEWTNSELGARIPKPDVPVIKEGGRDDEDCFMFNAFGMTIDDFNAYVEECKKLGYTVDPGEFDGFYSADDAEGYNVYLFYKEDDFCLSGTVEAPDDDE